MAELVESTTLLTWHRVKPIKGSNPFLSAIIKSRDIIPAFNKYNIYLNLPIIENIDIPKSTINVIEIINIIDITIN